MDERAPLSRTEAPQPGAGLWLVGGLLLLLVLLPYLLTAGLIELELVLAQPLLRLFLLLAGAALLLFALRRAAYRPAILPALAVLFLLREIGSTSGLSPFAVEPSADDLRLYSQNIGMQPPSAFADWLAKNPVDLLLLQEVYAGHLAEWELLAAKQGYALHFQPLRADAGMGGLILSRLPLTPLSPVRARSWGRRTRYFARARVDWRGQPLEIYTVHLESLPKVEGTRLLFGSARLRRHQAATLARQIAATPHLTILAGDLNAAPLYPSSRPLRRLLTDAWEEAGFGLGFTYPAGFPLSRIDAVLQRGFRTRSARLLQLSGSDHRGLLVTLAPLP